MSTEIHYYFSFIQDLPDTVKMVNDVIGMSFTRTESSDNYFCRFMSLDINLYPFKFDKTCDETYQNGANYCISSKLYSPSYYLLHTMVPTFVNIIVLLFTTKRITGALEYDQSLLLSKYRQNHEGRLYDIVSDHIVEVASHIRSIESAIEEYLT